MADREKLVELLSDLDRKKGVRGNPMSGATSPGGHPQPPDGQQLSRGRPRTYPYFEHLPYAVEDEAQRFENLEKMLEHLYIAVEAGDFAPGVLHWTRELRGWLTLKFDLTKGQRINLVKLYYELALAPGIDPNVAERFASMFMVLTKYDRCFSGMYESGC